MRAYVVTTGLMFALLVCAHIARLAVQGPRALQSPIFAVASSLSVGMLIWSVLLYQRLGGSRADDPPAGG